MSDLTKKRGNKKMRLNKLDGLRGVINVDILVKGHVLGGKGEKRERLSVVLE